MFKGQSRESLVSTAYVPASEPACHSKLGSCRQLDTPWGQVGAEASPKVSQEQERELAAQALPGVVFLLPLPALPLQQVSSG